MTEIHNVHAEILSLQHQLRQRFLDREEQITMLLICALAGSHPLMIGPPGSGKSALVGAIAEAAGQRPFIISGHGNLTMSDMFGPISLTAAKKDSHSRLWKKGLAGADFGVVDEVTRLSPSLQNALFPILNEGVFLDDGVRHPVNPIMIAGTDNHLELCQRDAAFFDRWTVRMMVPYLSPQGRIALRRISTQPRTPVTCNLTSQDFLQVRQALSTIQFSEDAYAALDMLDAKMTADEIHSSDRRWVSINPLLRAAAWLDGETVVQPYHIPVVIRNTMWHQLSHRSKVAKLVSAPAFSSPIDRIQDRIAKALADLERIDSSFPNLRVQTIQKASTTVKQQIDLLKKHRDSSTTVRAAVIDNLITETQSKLDALKQEAIRLSIL